MLAYICQHEILSIDKYMNLQRQVVTFPVYYGNYFQMIVKGCIFECKAVGPISASALEQSIPA